MDDVERRLRELGDRTAAEVTYREVPRRRIARRARVRRAAIVAAPVAAVVLFAAVAYPRLESSDDLNVGTPVAVDLGAAAEATEDEGSSRFEMSVSMEVEGRTITMAGTGLFEFDGARSYFRVTENGVFGASGGEYEIISIGTEVFQRPVGEAKWVRSEVPRPQTASLVGPGPDDFFAYLESVSEDIVSLGDEVLDGVTVTHLRATLDLTALDDVMSRSGMEFEPVDIWIDDANRVRKMEFGSTFDGSDAASRETMTSTMRFWDFGVDVDVEAPAPEDVTEQAPEGWGGLLGGESSSESDVDLGGNVTMIMGDRDVETPYVEVDTQDPSLVEVCAYSTTPVTSARLVHRASGRLVALFHPVRGDGHFDGPVVVACVEQAISRADLEALVDEPTEFTLNVWRRGGNHESVELSQTAVSMRRDVAEE